MTCNDAGGSGTSAVTTGHAEAGTYPRWGERCIARPAQNDQFLDTRQAAHYIRYSVSSLEGWRIMSPARGPRFYKMAGRVRYKQSDLDAWMESGLVETRG